MLPELLAAGNSLKTAIEIIKYFTSISKENAINEKAIELQQIILSLQQNILEAQGNYQKLYNEKEIIENQLKKIMNWNKERNKYKISNLTNDVFVYVLKNPKDEVEKSLKFCSNCFQNQKISLIQLDQDTMLEKVYICHSCGSKYKIKNNSKPTVGIIKNNFRRGY